MATVIFKTRMIGMIIRCYKELSRIESYEERFRYLKLVGQVGESTFGFDRYLNQIVYSSRKWKQVRNAVIIRDEGRDMGVEGYEIQGRIVIHHMNPISIEDAEKDSDFIYDPEFLICVAPITHNAIHYGDESLLPKDPIDRFPNDTCPWRR